MEDLIAVIGFVLLALGVVFGIAVGIWLILVVPQYKSSCYDYGQNTHHEVRFSQPNWGAANCYVKMSNGWFELQQLQQNSVAQ